VKTLQALNSEVGERMHDVQRPVPPTAAGARFSTDGIAQDRFFDEVLRSAIPGTRALEIDYAAV